MHVLLPIIPARFVAAMVEVLTDFGLSTKVRNAVAPFEYDVHGFTADPIMGEEAEREAKTLLISLMVREEVARASYQQPSMAARY